MKHVKVHCIRVPRSCGCSSPIAAIYTGNIADAISIESHSRVVNQNCSGRTKGISTIRRWLSVTDWLSKYTHTRNRSEYRAYLRVQCLDLKEKNPRIPESTLL